VIEEGRVAWYWLRWPRSGGVETVAARFGEGSGAGTVEGPAVWGGLVAISVEAVPSDIFEEMSESSSKASANHL